MNKHVVSIEFTNNHNKNTKNFLGVKEKNVVLSGDDMLCYLLFPEVLFHYIDKMEKARS